MKVNCKFKNLDYSDALVEYSREKLQKLEKLELKPTRIHVTFSAQRHEKVAEIHFQYMNARLQTKVKTESFYESVDKAVNKISRQMSKKKDRVQHHKNYELSHMGRLDHMEAEEEEMAEQTLEGPSLEEAAKKMKKVV